MAVSHFSSQFQISAGAETSHVIVTTLQPGGRSEISAWAEFRHVIGLIIFFFQFVNLSQRLFFFFQNFKYTMCQVAINYSLFTQLLYKPS